jgi:glycosyltransferase involved in cell wall biosynthesis
MKKPLRILLIGNYEGDAQPSMNRFASLLERELKQLSCDVRTVRAMPVINRRLTSQSASSKWLGYIDKYVLFPTDLQQHVDWADIVHICDHSNAVYAPLIQGKPVVVTCHDMLAVRGALGEETCCPASVTGKMLQRWILFGLRRADRRVCVSTYTQKDVQRLMPDPSNERTQVVLNAVDPILGKIPAETAIDRLKEVDKRLNQQPFILHVGSNLERKNRDGVLRIFKRIKDSFPGWLVFAGAGLSPSLKSLAAELQLTERIIEVTKPHDLVLEALYNRAYALLFPSRFEGFGWPIIEAQACGCPVVCSDAGPFPEVALDSALICPLDDEEKFGNLLLSLHDPNQRAEWSRRGLNNVRRFTPRQAAERHLQIYKGLLVNEALHPVEIT